MDTGPHVPGNGALPGWMAGVMPDDADETERACEFRRYFDCRENGEQQVILNGKM